MAVVKISDYVNGIFNFDGFPPYNAIAELTKAFEGLDGTI